uniref:DNA polymerase eta n=1 Tax=Strigamia maritima TaxID=126957 RepID=T1ILF2_STRMM
MANRIIVLIDMDCFYAQVEQKLKPETLGKPCAVVQYKTWKGGGIIAVNYEARAAGVTRNMFGDDAKNLCPDIYLARVPESRGKADLTRYRDASKDVFAVLTRFSEFVERASIDEAYIDLTLEIQKRFKVSKRITGQDLLNTHVVGLERENETGSRCDDDRFEGVEEWLREIYDEDLPDVLSQQLAIAGEMVEGIRAAVFKETGFHCSAGIAHNKKIYRNLGGKLGDTLVETLKCETMRDLSQKTQKELESQFGDKLGSWLFDLARGIDFEAVNPRQLPKSIGCSKNFAGKTALKKIDEVKHWVGQLAAEVVERVTDDLKSNKRMAKILAITMRYGGNEPNNITRSCPIYVYDTEKIAHDVMAILNKHNKGTNGEWFPPIYCLGISAGKFQDHIEANMANIKTFFHKDKVNNTILDPISSEKSTESPKKGFFATKLEEAKRKNVENREDNSTIVSKERENDKISDGKAGIKKFFGNSTGNEEASCSSVNIESPVTVPDDCFPCEDCGKMISVWKSIEHSDQHIAEKLFDELKREDGITNSTISKTTPPSSKRTNSKRKNNSKTPLKRKKSDPNQPEQKIRKIDTFFHKI